MLNKLLKRCMPWMDKGRWYHFCVKNNENGEISITHDSIFSRYEVVGPQVNLYFADPAPKYSIPFFKSITQPTDVDHYISPDNNTLDVVYSEENGYYIPMLPIIGSIDYWMYIVKG